MMTFSRVIARYVHTGRSYWTAEKSLLAKLRKKTGYTFANCKKALELHNNDITQAEKWLKEQAQAMGWSKATKLEGRQTSQGLVAVILDKNIGAMIELNCETDFVARNKNFQDMVEKAARACLSFASKQEHQSSLTKIQLDQVQLKSLVAPDGKSLSDHLALFIGSVGENASLRRAFCFKSDPKFHLNGYTHPSTPDKLEVGLGRIGALLAYRFKEHRKENVELISRQICQHIVGLNPIKIGSELDKPEKNSEDEKCLIYQDFVLDDSLKVKDVLDENGIEIIDFKRFECGEQNEIEQETVEKIANSQ